MTILKKEGRKSHFLETFIICRCLIHTVKIMFYFTCISCWTLVPERPILKSKCMRAIFQKKGKKGQQMLKKGTIFEDFGKYVRNWKIFLKRAVIITRNKLLE